MKVSIVFIIALLSFVQLHGKGNKSVSPANTTPDLTLMKGSKFWLKYQVFESHDKAGTDIDTVHNEGDYILFSMTGEAYMNFKDKLDSIRYDFPTKTSVSFGDTPFTITYLGKGFYKLYQNETAANGDYNKVTYLLKQDDPS